MKIRTNYVSNSSSSSFIISYNPEAKTILKSDNGVEIEFKVIDFINEIRNKYEDYGECTMINREGSDSIYSYNAEWWEEGAVKELKDFLDKNPQDYKIELQISYNDKFIKKTLLNLHKLGLVDVLADEYAMRDDC